mgnify:CR=1 FL=1
MIDRLLNYRWGVAIALILGGIPFTAMAEPLRVPSWAHNHFLDGKVRGNIKSYDKGVRGKPDHVVYNVEEGAFQRLSSWHEYGIDAGSDLGIVSEDQPVWWRSEWETPVTCNLISLRGCYPNQPQPETAWKIELRSDGVWREHARGVGGWYNDGYYGWRVPLAEAISFDGFRVSLFSKDDKTPLTSVHFRGETGNSWVVAAVSDVDGRLVVNTSRVRLWESISFTGEPIDSDISTWNWDFGDGATSTEKSVIHTYAEPGTYVVRLSFSDGEEHATVKTEVQVNSPVLARITPLEKTVRAGDVVSFDASTSLGPVKETYVWDYGDGNGANGVAVDHTFAAPGFYTVQLNAGEGAISDGCSARIRVHARDAAIVPELLLDSDQKNEQDDQYFLGYAVFSEMDLLGINSVHHGGGQEQMNYDEIVHVLSLAKESGAPDARLPHIFRGADKRLAVPESGRWEDTMPMETAAAEAILAVARGASPENPPWIVPVGPGTNVASAVLMAREEGLDLTTRIRIMWLGGSNDAITQEFNGNNDPWSLYVIGQSGVPLWIMPAPVGARVLIDKRTETDLYPKNPLGAYLEKITPSRNKPLYDPAVLSAIIDIHENLGWIKGVEYAILKGPEEKYRWETTTTKTPVTLIREIDAEAMKNDIFDSLKGNPTALRK